MSDEIVTTKIKRESLKKLKIVAATSSEKMTDVLARLIDAEFSKSQGGHQDEDHARVQD